MQLEARVKSTIDLLDIFFSTKAPFDIVMSKYFKNNRWIGSNDRRTIAEFSYSIFRNFEKLRYLCKKITGNFGRFYVISFLKNEKHYTLKQIEEIFSGRTYAPQKLSDFEIKFLNNLTTDFPEFAELNYPEWLEPYLKESLGEASFKEEMLALNHKAPLDLRVNTLKTSKDEVIKLLNDFQLENMTYAENGLRIANGRIGRGHIALSKGFVEIQDEGSQLIAKICNASEKDTVIDYCAGAGGKTLALACYMKNKGRIFALDKYSERLKNAKIRFKRAGVNNVFCQEITSKWLKRHVEIANIVLVDAPCSGTGTWRRNPDMRAQFSKEDLDELIHVQADILRIAQKLVKPGGRLVYSTCSLLKNENENQINQFLQEFPEFKLQKIEIENYNGDFLKLSPFRNNTDGFFAASLIKN